MKEVVYTLPALKSLKLHSNVRERIMRAISEYAADQQAHANQVAALVGVNAKRLRIGDFRVIFEETVDRIIVTKIGPRGGVYD